MDCRFSNLNNATLYDDNNFHLTTEYSKCAWWNQHDTYTTDIIQLSASHTQTLTPSTNKTPIHNELGYVEFWNQNYPSKTVNSTPCANESQKTKELEPNELREVLNHVPALQRPLQKREGKKVKFIMIATSLDKTTILKKLGEALNKETCQAIPLSFRKENNDDNRGISEDGRGKESETVVVKSKETVNGHVKERVKYGKQNSVRSDLKRKQNRITQKEHWKHGCSRKIVTVQMSCAGTKSEIATCMKDASTNEFEEEDSELERQIKMLKTSELLQTS